jgi:hypothetical protein
MRDGLTVSTGRETEAVVAPARSRMRNGWIVSITTDAKQRKRMRDGWIVSTAMLPGTGKRMQDGSAVSTSRDLRFFLMYPSAHVHPAHLRLPQPGPFCPCDTRDRALRDGRLRARAQGQHAPANGHHQFPRSVHDRWRLAVACGVLRPAQLTCRLSHFERRSVA